MNKTRTVGAVVCFGAIVAACVAKNVTTSDESAPSQAGVTATAPAPVVSPPTAGPTPAPMPTPYKPAPLSSLTGPRTFDWTSSRVTYRATHGVPPAEIAAANARLQPEFSMTTFNVTTGSPVTSAAAVYGANWVESSPSASDLLFFGVNASTFSTGIGITGGIAGGATTASKNNNFFALNNLYQASTPPTMVWKASLPSGGINGNAVALTSDGTEVFVATTGGKLACYFTGVIAGSSGGTGGAGCTGFTTYSNGGCAINNSGPWINYLNDGSAIGDVYFGDDCGYVQRVNGTTGAVVWRIQPGASGFRAPFESSPVVLNGYIYIGDDYGQLFQLTDTSSSGGPTTVASYATCSVIGDSAPCPGALTDGGTAGSPWAIRTAISIDTVNLHVYSVANDYVFEMNGDGVWAPTAASPKHLNSGGTGPMTSSPVLDSTNSFLYTGFNNNLYKIPYPFGGTSTAQIYAAPMGNSGTGANPPVDPLPYNNVTYVGDNTGTMERFDCTTQAGSAAVDGVSQATYGSSITTPSTIDYSTGNVNFGYTTSTSKGGLVQYPLSPVSQYACPTSLPNLCTGASSPLCYTAGGTQYTGDSCRQCCGTGTTAQCGGGTCTNGVCATACTGTSTTTCATPQAGSQVACVSGACVYTCLTSYTDCTGNIQANGCTDTTSDPNNCGGCGSACSTNNVPIPTCVSGACSGNCADGFIDCTGTRASGCNSLATCGNCCGTVCAAGTICYDQGAGNSPGAACVTDQTTQAYGRASQNNSVTASCPSGQTITGITFADYGTPLGSGGQSWTSGTTNNCPGAGSASVCEAATGCLWTGTACIFGSCSDVTTSTACTTTTGGCAWSAPTGTCIPSGCSGVATSTACAAVTTASCTWLSSLGVCVGSTGFAHDYGSTPNNTYPSNCAMDVSMDTKVTACVGASTCTISAADGVLGTGTNTPSGSTLPLSTVPSGGGTPSAYPSDPCSSLAKSMELQVTCGTCTGATAAYSDVTDVPGNQTNYSGALGMEFTVNSSIEINSLGAWDPATAGFSSGVNVTVAIYNVATQMIVTNSLSQPLEAVIPAGTTLTGADRFVTLSGSFTLGTGTYMVVAWGYNNSHNASTNYYDYNSMGSTTGTSTENTGGGLISFTGVGYFDTAGTTGSTTAIDFPTTADSGPTNRYGGGTFTFIATPPGICTVGGGAPPCASGSTCLQGSGCISNLCENSVCDGNTLSYIAYGDTSQVGSQTNFSGTLGMLFYVNTPITVTQVGAFDSGGDGFTNPVTVAIYSGGTATCSATGTSIVAGTQATLTGTSQPLVGGDRFYTLATPIILSPGPYTMVAGDTWGTADPDGNSGVGSGWVLNTENGGSTLSDAGMEVTFFGNACFLTQSPFTTLAYPTSMDSSPANRYGGGTFIFHN